MVGVLSIAQGIIQTMKNSAVPENAADPKDVAEVMTFVVGYALAIEQVLAQAAGRSGTLPGHSVSVRGYVEQALGGEARAASLLRLNNYFKDAIVFFMNRALMKPVGEITSVMQKAEKGDYISPFDL